MSSFLFILNDAPYGTERSYNGLRLARQLLKAGAGEVKLFLIGDAVACAKAGQAVPQGYYNAGDMLAMVISAGCEVSVCGTCLDAGGLAPEELIAGAQRGSMELLANWTLWADKEISF